MAAVRVLAHRLINPPSPSLHFSIPQDEQKEIEETVERTPIRTRKIVPDAKTRAPNAAWDSKDIICDITDKNNDDISKRNYSESSDKENSVLLPPSFNSPKIHPISARDQKTSCKYIDVAENGVGAGNIKYFSPYVHLISPASTNVTSFDDDSVSLDIISTIRRKDKTKRPYLKFLCPPYFILAASLVEISIFIWGNETLDNVLMYSPYHKHQVWRFISYMLLHSGSIHLTLNIIIQTLLATPLELEQGSWRCAMVYLGGGLAGALGASVMQPTLFMVGASAGVYALLISHLAIVILGYSTIRYKIFRVFAVTVLAGSDVAFSVAHWWVAGGTSPTIGWAAHCAGAAAGAVLGMLVYKGSDRENIYMRAAIWTSLAVLIIGILICLFFNIFLF